jgi:hypothetical protein
MASRQENLKTTYPLKITTGRFGWHFNERPQPDALGRLPATPLEILRAMRGEFNLSFQQPTDNPREQRGRPAPEYKHLKQAREQRKKEARLKKLNRGKGKERG